MAFRYLTRHRIIVMVLRVSLLCLVAATITSAVGPAVAVTSSQLDVSSLDWFRTTTWRSKDGLPSVTVQSLVQDRDGYLLLGLHGAVARFDGVAFKRLSVSPLLAPGTQVRSIRQDADGTVWAATLTQGLLRLSGGKSRYFTVKDGLPSDNVADTCRDSNGTLWVGTTAGLVNYVDEHFVRPPVAPKSRGVVSLACTSDGSVWIAPGDGPAWRVRHGQSELFLDHDGIEGPSINHVYVNARDQIFLGWAEGGVTRIDSRGTTHFGVQHGLSRHRVMSMTEDARGDLWIGTWGGGVSKWQDDHFVSVGIKDGLGSDAVTALVRDREGSIWVGTTGGLTQIVERPFRTLSARHGLLGPLLGPLAHTPDGAIWIGSEGGGVLRIRGDKSSRFLTLDGLPCDTVSTLASSDDGTVFVGTPKGVAQIAPNSDRAVAIPGTNVGRDVGAFSDRKGRVWIFGWYFPLSRLEGDKLIPVLNSSEATQKISLMAQDASGDLWAGGELGLVKLNPMNMTVEPMAGVSAVTGLSPARDGCLWIATRAGLVRRMHDGRLQAHWPEVVADVSGSVIEAATNQVWIGTQAGLVRFDLATRNVMRWTTSDGLSSADFTYPSAPRAIHGPQGTLLFSTTEELVIVNPTRLQANALAPPVIIEQARVDGVRIESKNARVAPGARRIEFAFTALSFRAPDALRFRFRLDGFESEWNLAGNHREASYTNLPPGRFEFHVSAANESGVWNNTGAHFAFFVAPHFYERTLFQFGMLIMLAAVIPGAIHWVRVRRLRSRFAILTEERNRIARDLHDTLEQGFTGAILHLKAAETLASNVPQAGEHIRSVRSIVRHMHSDTRHHIWDLRGRGHSHGDLASALTATLDQVAANSNLVPVFKLEGTSRTIPAAVETTLLRVAQEALTNSQKHAAATEVRVQLTFDKDTVTLQITDNGRGFLTNAAESMNGRLGLVGMAERVARIGANLIIDSSPGKGTKVTVKAHV